MISDTHMDILTNRGLDVELADKLGLETVSRAGGSALVIPFKRAGDVVRRKYRRFDVEEGKWSADKGVTWNEFYASGTLNDDVSNEDEVYVGMFADVRFLFTAAVENATVFRAALALHCAKPTSKITTADVLVNALA